MWRITLQNHDSCFMTDCHNITVSCFDGDSGLGRGCSYGSTGHSPSGDPHLQGGLPFL